MEVSHSNMTGLSSQESNTFLRNSQITDPTSHLQDCLVYNDKPPNLSWRPEERWEPVDPYSDWFSWGTGKRASLKDPSSWGLPWREIRN